jgi:hypothetical protein
MENNEFHNAWKNIDSGIKASSRDEFERILRSKKREMINDDYYTLAFSSALGVGFLLFLTLITIPRVEDVYFIINNILLAVFILYFQSRKILKYRQLNQDNKVLPVREWVKLRIEILDRWVNDKSAYIALPFGFILGYLSVTVYMSSQRYVEVLSEAGSVAGLIAGFITGLSAAFLSVRAIRKKQMRNLEKLEELLEQMK